MKKLLVLAALVLLAVPATAGSTVSERATKTVGAYNNYFSPKSIEVKRGTKVTWTVRKGVHNVKGKGFSSSLMTKGRKFSRTFKSRGTYGYVCTIHPGMKGKVVVR